MVLACVPLCGCWMMLQIERDHLHGKADLGQSAVVYRNKRRRIDVDADDVIFHLKVIVRLTDNCTHVRADRLSHTQNSFGSRLFTAAGPHE